MGIIAVELKILLKEIKVRCFIMSYKITVMSRTWIEGQLILERQSLDDGYHVQYPGYYKT